jgi:Domain of Unknown Function (DUF1080)
LLSFQGRPISPRNEKTSRPFKLEAKMQLATSVNAANICGDRKVLVAAAIMNISGRKILVLSCAGAVWFSAPAQEWQSLFDGKTLNGWKASEHAASFHVVDGALACDGPRAHLFFTGADERADFKNFELLVEVKSRPGANSGVFFHTAFQERDFPEQGFEAQVLNSRVGEGGYRENKLTGSLYGVRNVYKPLVRDDEWFTMHLTVRGQRVLIRLNDTLVVDYLEPATGPDVPGHPGRRLSHGTFALQCHDAGSKVLFRNLRVKRLPDELPENHQPGPAMTEYGKEIIRLGSANYPVVNFHSHLKGGLTLEEALEFSRRTGVFLGIAVNCGLNFSVTNDTGIYDYLNSVKGAPAFIAMQAEGREWVKMFSREAISKFDYVFTDSMTIFDDSGRRMRLWIPSEVPEIKDKQGFMDMLVDRAVKILSTEPINIYVNPTFLPDQIAGEYDQLWTEARMQKVIAAAAEKHVAIEINSRYKLPSLKFIQLAKAAGCKFTFGTNNGDKDIGKLDYSFDMVEKAGLNWQDIWIPGEK